MRVWAYVNERGTLCCALLKESVPANVRAVELEVETPEDVVLDNGQIRVKTEQEKLETMKRDALMELKMTISNLLAPTDYILLKITEAQALGENIEPLLTRYAHELSQRQAIRGWNASTKEAIKNAKTRAELQLILEEMRTRLTFSSE
jgi:hypothetical protein